MKILSINCVYGVGSTGKIVQSLHQWLQNNDIDSVAYYGRGKLTRQAGVRKVSFELYAKFNNLLSRVRGLMYGGCFFSTKFLIHRIKCENPDIVHLHCVNGYFVNIYSLIRWLKQNNIKTVLTLHSEFMFTGNCGHAFDCEKWTVGCYDCACFRKETKSLFFDRTQKSFQLMKQAFEGFSSNLRIVSVSPWLQKRAQRSCILGDKLHRCVYNGVDSSIFIYKNNMAKYKFCPNGEKMLFHATASFTDDPSDLKGGIWLLRLAHKMKDQNVKFIVAGKAKLKQQIPNNVIVLGELNKQEELASLYCCADLTLLTSKRETFSMVVAESLCCGTPVVGFEAGAPEEITINDYSAFGPYGDLDLLYKNVNDLLNTVFDKKEISVAAVEKYSTKKMAEHYMSIYNELM